MDAGPVMSLAQAGECGHTWLHSEPCCVCLAVSARICSARDFFFYVGQGRTALRQWSSRGEFGDVMRTMCGLGGRALSEVVTGWV
jgi:hypothetical protein